MSQPGSRHRKRRRQGRSFSGSKRPLRAADLFEILAQLDDGTAQGLRDRSRSTVGPRICGCG
jgi:hypothetical protein